MSESGEVRVSAIEAEHVVKIPDKFDHKGQRFESPKADSRLDQIRERVTSERVKPSVVDLLDIVGRELEDIEDQKQYVFDKKQMVPATRELKGIQDTLLKVAAHQFDQISMIDKTKVHTYLKRQQFRWEIKGSTQDLDDQERAAIAANQEMFEDLEKNLFSKEKSEPESTDKESVKEEETVVENETKIDPIEMYDFHPEARSAFEHLQNFRDKDVTIDTFGEALDLLEDDISAEEREFIEANPEWQDKKNAVSAANIKFMQRLEAEGRDALEDDVLYAVVDRTGSALASWEKPEKIHEGSKQYAFTFKQDAYDPTYANYFDKHVDNVKLFDKWRDSISEGKRLIQKVQESQLLTPQEGLILARFVDIMRTAVPDDTTDESQKDLSTVNNLSKLVTESIDQKRPKK